MDVARAIEKLDSKASYLLNHSQADGKQEILEWRGPGICPTDTQLDAAWLLCLDDDAEEQRIEQEREKAIERIKADPELSDISLVLRL